MTDNIDPTIKQLELEVAKLKHIIKNLCFLNQSNGHVHYTYQKDVDLKQLHPELKDILK